MYFLILACGHTFHHHCVDPWLLDRRHCPLCNLDILAAYRVPVPSEYRAANNSTLTQPEIRPYTIATSADATVTASGAFNRLNESQINKQESNDVIDTRSAVATTMMMPTPATTADTRMMAAAIPTISAAIHNSYYRPPQLSESYNDTLISSSSMQQLIDEPEKDQNGLSNPTFVYT